jgi:hypothetical protein
MLIQPENPRMTQRCVQELKSRIVRRRQSSKVPSSITSTNEGTVMLLTKQREKPANSSRQAERPKVSDSRDEEQKEDPDIQRMESGI